MVFLENRIEQRKMKTKKFNNAKQRLNGIKRRKKRNKYLEKSKKIYE